MNCLFYVLEEVLKKFGYFFISAIYFKGVWETGFGYKTNEWFYFDTFRREMVPTMIMKDYYLHGYILEMNADFVVLPFKVHNFNIFLRLDIDDIIVRAHIGSYVFLFLSHIFQLKWNIFETFISKNIF